MEKTLKKKSQRFSMKKITSTHRRNDTRVIQQSKLINDRVRSYGKNKSSQKSQQSTNLFHKFKIGKPTPTQKQRIKTEVDQYINFKTPYQKYLNFKKKDKQQRYKFRPQEKEKKSQRATNLSHYQSDGKSKVKRLNLNPDLFHNIKNSSLQKAQAPHSGKYAHHSFRKQHESHRSGQKKTALQKYISESLQSLQHPKKKMFQHESESKRQGDETILREKKKPLKQLRVCQQTTQQIKQQMSPKVQYNNFQESQRKLKTEKDESLEKFQIKFQKKRKNPYDLSKQEQQTFGDRFPDGFQKIKLLGRGGFSLVWLGQHKKTKKKYAVKQIITDSSHQTHIKQIWFGTNFFEFGGAPKEEYAQCPGIKNLVKLYFYFVNKKDTWILYEKCGDSLGNALYDLKGQYNNGQKLYRMYYKSLYSRLRKNQDQIRHIIFEVAQALQLLADCNIVHSDLKTENILVRMKTQQQMQKESNITIAQTKLIDYGSSFVFNNLKQFSMATPEYMAPQILNYILHQNDLEYIPKLLEYVNNYNKPWVIDVWSLGCVVLEIVSGIPLWMSLKTIVRKKSAQLVKYGLFAIKGRLFDKIIRRQIEVIQNLDHYLYEQNYSGIVLEDDLRILLKRMLALNPEKRISPSEIIQFLSDKRSVSETL